ncbi:YjzD family protein [Guptibacillus algicola]|uniref:YjzD family protein n=1 Tax=Guptibacillus algicola TaxID=225844 RepID=UPI001CD4C8DD|nr:YjzD family protein [Alkalihalobacillus algicola]MCA0987794.1 YjzD family protein [Alkalihalobacillus algicola]
MRYIWAIIWGFLLSNMIFYVLASMQGGSFNFPAAIIFGVIISAAAIVLGDGVITDSAEQ